VLCFWLCNPFGDCSSVNEEEGTVEFSTFSKKEKRKRERSINQSLSKICSFLFIPISD
jgi:hypothetical protein